MSAGDTARAAYESARTELITRIRLRDNALLFYLAIVGTLFGLGIGIRSKPEILLTIPFIALGAGILVAHGLAGQTCGTSITKQITIF